MRHRIAGRKLSRDTEHRTALFRNMAASLFTHGQITTTLPKAKAVQPFVEKLITLAKRGDLHARRLVLSKLQDRIIVKDDTDEDVKRNSYGEIIKQGVKQPKLVAKLFDEIAPQYADRNGGYTRIIKLAKHRIGDGADLCVLQLVSDEDGGPQVSGQLSRRRNKANKRMEFAAKLRKGDPAEETAEAVEEVVEETATAVAEEAAPEETPEVEAEATEEATPEAEEEKKD